MKRIALAILATVILAAPASATVFDDVEADITAALDAYGEGQRVEAKADLYAIATDATIPEACAQYADINLAGLVILDGLETAPDSWALGILFKYVLEGIPIMQNNCRLAI